MPRRVPMTTLACNSAVVKRQTLEVVAGSGILTLYIAHVAAHATEGHWQCRRHSLEVRQPGFHVIPFGAGVVGDRRLQKISVDGIKISDAEMPGAEEIVEL